MSLRVCVESTMASMRRLTDQLQSAPTAASVAPYSSDAGAALSTGAAGAADERLLARAGGGASITVGWWVRGAGGGGGLRGVAVGDKSERGLRMLFAPLLTSRLLQSPASPL